MSAKGFKELQLSTQAFFNLHWKEELGPQPQWSEAWHFKGPIPHHQEKGCYAFFDEKGELVYIGIGLGLNGKGQYTGHGLGHRLQRIRHGRDPYSPRQGYEYIDHIRTLSFGTEKGDFFYLGAALEIYLIQELQPEKNVTYKT